MELRQLSYFVAVAEEASFTRAAQRVRISQSGVSAQIRLLERELGVELIDRSGRQATLTSAGRQVLEHARSALAAADAARQAADETNDLLRGELTIGMVIGCTIEPLFSALASFRSAFPMVNLSLLEDSSDRLIARVRHGAIDLALVATPGEPPSGVGSFTVISEGLVALIPDGHPLLGAGPRISLAELCEHPLVCMPPGTGLRGVLDQACAARGLSPALALEASAGEAIIQLARRGLGVGILSESMAKAAPGGLTVLPIDGIEIPAVLAVIWTPAVPPALRELVARCRTAFAGPADAH
jgi:DNA-binding transcriptional LysR family regulator